MNGSGDSPSRASWFTDDLVYQGEGRAEFADPHGFAEGPAIASFRPDGSAHVSLDVERCEADEPLRFGLWQLLSKRRPQKVGAATAIGFSGVTNPCTGFTIKTPNGLFAMTEKITAGARLHLGSDGGTLQFHSIWSTYESNDAGPTRYWVLPLRNFVETLLPPPLTAGHHPLRLSPTAETASNVSSEKDEHTGGPPSQLIAFTFEGEPAFVEPLPGFSSRKECGHPAHP